MAEDTDSASSASNTVYLESNVPLLESTVSLDALQNEEQRKVLNIVDSLRQCGLDGIVALPQLVVCGDQSSGKSSVLEAITEIPFPRKDTLCTRFATEIVMRRAPTPYIETKIIADATRPAAERQNLDKFQMSITDFSELPRLIDEATNVMGLGDSTGGVRAFSKDVLRIEIMGPKRPQLTLVDLPGLIHSETKTQSKEDVLVVSELVQQYIENARTIILAIVSAKNDYANQVVLDRARAVDKDGSRTLGIITKPDDLQPGSENETAFINLAKNEDIFFSLGWHCVRNRGFPERNHSFEQRNQLEKAFFGKGRWLELDRDALGIDALRIRLSSLLFQHIKQELPRLREDLNGKYEQTCSSLEQIGLKREDERQQREYLMKLSLVFNDLAKAAVNGHYEGAFFGRVDTESNFENCLDAHSRRLRAIIQYSNMKFANRMRKLGHKYKFEGLATLSGDEDDEVDDKENKADDKGKSSIDAERQTTLSPDESLDWVKQVLLRTKGVELPGNFNPLVVGELFWEQSESWFTLAQDHAEAVSELCKYFVDDLLKEICPADVYIRLQSTCIEEALKNRFDAAEIELKKITEDLKRHPATWNHYYTTTVTRMRRRHDEDVLKKALEDATTRSAITTNTNQTVTNIVVDTTKAVREFQGLAEQDMEKHACQDALTDLRAYYKVAIKTFIDNVNTQVVERHVVQGLEKVFSPMTVGTWSADEIYGLASEPFAIIRQREHLENRKTAIENGMKVFRAMMRRT